jgi:hypothetical protein
MSAALTSRRLTIVDGYLPIDEQPLGLRLRNEARRLGLIINEYYPELPGGFFFDHELAVSIARILGAVGDGIVIRFEPEAFNDLGRTVVRRYVPTWAPGEPLVIDDLDTLSRIYDDIFEVDNQDDPGENVSFDEMLVMAGGSTIIEVQTVDYHRFGGPDPYHDQLLWNVYLEPSIGDALVEKLSDMASRFGMALNHLRGSR